MKKEKQFNIRRTNGTEPFEPWLEKALIAFAKREYGLNITVTVTERIKDNMIPQ